MSVEISITDQIVEINEVSNPVEISVSAGASVSPVWGGITGTLSNQTDLQNALNAKFDDPTGTTSQYLRGDGTLATFPTIPSGTVTSVGLTMPTAFTVAGSPVTSSGTLAITGAGTASQYIRGDGQLANFPDNQAGGSSVNYYLNGSVTQGTFGGTTYYEMSKTPILGAGTNFTRTNGQGNGYIASFITDAGDPSLLNIPAGNWNLEFYFQSSSTGGSPQFYAELYKVDASNNFTLVGSGSTNPEGITNGTTVDQYFTSIPVPQTSLLVTDRLAIRIFVIPAGRTITLHTENSNLCEVLTTLSTGLNALNGLTAQVQYFATGTSGTDFAISSATDTHTFNLPTASATNRGALSSADWTTFNSKQNALTNPITGTGTAGQVAYFTGATTQAGSNNLFWDNTNGRLGIGTATPQQGLSIIRNENTSSGIETQNLSTGAAANSGIIVRNSASAGQLFKLGTGYVSYKTLVASDLGFYNAGGGDISILNETSSGKIKFLSGNIATTAQMTLTANGRLLLGSTTEGTQILQVTGDTLLKGSGNTSATTALTVQNSDGNTLLRVVNNGTIAFRTDNLTSIIPTNDSFNVAVNGNSLRFTSNLLSTATYGYNFINSNGSVSWTSGIGGAIYVVNGYNPTSGTGQYRWINLEGTINQTGGANGITRGLYVNPTLTAAADWRSIEWSNNSGWGLYGAGTANNYLAGSLGIGSTSLTGHSLRVSKTITGAATSYGLFLDGQAQSDVTGAAVYVQTNASTQAATFTMGNLYHFIAAQGSFGAGTTVATQRGFLAASSLIGATNNYGFDGQIPAGTGRWNLYMQGTALNYLNGDTGFSTTTPLTKVHIRTGNASSTLEGLRLANGSNDPNAGNRLSFFFSDSASNIGGAFIDVVKNGSDGNILLSTSATNGTPTEKVRIFGDGNVGINTGSTNSGERLQVTGTAKITGATTFGTVGAGTGLSWDNTNNRLNIGNALPTNVANQNIVAATSIVGFSAKNTSSASGSTQAGFYVENNSGFAGQLYKTGSSYTTYKIISANDLGFYNAGGGGNISILNDFATGTINFAAGASSTAQMTLTSAGNLCIGVTSGGDFLNIAASTTAKSQINLTNGVAPTSPNNGDIWFDGTNLKMQIGGVTKTFTLV